MTVTFGIPELAIGTLLFTGLQFIVAKWAAERIRASMTRKTAELLEDKKRDERIRLQAAKVAEYLSIAYYLKDDDPSDVYQRANKLGWELALWLPDDLYIKVVRGITERTRDDNPLSVLQDVRKYLLKDKAGGLTQDNIAHHYPEIGNTNSA